MCIQKRKYILYGTEAQERDLQILVKIGIRWQRILKRMAKDIEDWMEERGKAAV